VIPHCFFELTPLFLPGCVCVGTFTTWGEMRTVSHLLKLLLALFALGKARLTLNQPPIVGYLGGKPVAEIAPERVRELCASLAPDLSVLVMDVKSYDLKKFSQEHVILVDTGSAEFLTPHFNTQLYHLGHKIRTGESSGSAHACAGIKS
jgi:hypothetical protein